MDMNYMIFTIVAVLPQTCLPYAACHVAKQELEQLDELLCM
jgi:hypothetical protein